MSCLSLFSDVKSSFLLRIAASSQFFLHRWVNIGKERDGMAPDAVQYARALRPPYHLLSFLRIKVIVN